MTEVASQIAETRAHINGACRIIRVLCGDELTEAGLIQGNGQIDFGGLEAQFPEEFAAGVQRFNTWDPTDPNRFVSPKEMSKASNLAKIAFKAGIFSSERKAMRGQAV